MGSSGKGGGGTPQYDYFGDAAGVVGSGMTYGDELVAIVVEKKEAWTGPLRFVSGSPGEGETASNPVLITIENYGDLYFYWGTEDQTLPSDSVVRAENNDEGEDSPPLRGFAWVELRQFLFGREKKQPPDIQVVVRRHPKQSVITGAAASFDEGQVNPFALLAGMFEERRFGLGVSAAKLDGASWQAAADAADPELHYVSIRQTKQEAARKIVAEAFAVIEGYLLHDEALGKIKAAKWPTGSEIDVESLPIIDADDLEDIPSFEVEDWNDVPTGAVVVFRDRERAFKETSERETNPVASRVRAEPKVETLQRALVRRSTQARALATEYARLFCRPGFAAGDIDCRRAKTAARKTGEIVRIDVDPEPGGSQLHQVSRIVRKAGGMSGVQRIEFEPVRSLAPRPYTPALPAPGGPVQSEPAEIVNLRIIELPPPLAEGNDYTIAVLASRPEKQVTEFNLLYDSDNVAGDFPRIGGQRTFAIRGQLNSAFSDTDAGPIDVEVLDTPQSGILDADPGDAASRNDYLFAILVKVDDGQVAVDADDLPIMEFLSVNSFSGSLSSLQVNVLRARAGTIQHAFAAGDEVWFILRSNMQRYAHLDFPDLYAAASPAYFKLQSIAGLAQRSLGSLATREFYFPGGRAYAPSIAWSTPGSDPDVEQTASSGGSITFAGVVSDQDSNLVSLTVFSRKSDGAESTHFSQSFSPRASYSFSVGVSFPSAGTYFVTARAQDSTGRTTESDWIVQVDYVPAAKVATPKLSPNGGTYRFQVTVSITCATSGAKIRYQIVPFDTAPGGTWTEGAVDEDLSVSVPADRRLFAYAIDPTATLSDSDQVVGYYYRQIRFEGDDYYWILP